MCEQVLTFFYVGLNQCAFYVTDLHDNRRWCSTEVRSSGSTVWPSDVITEAGVGMDNLLDADIVPKSGGLLARQNIRRVWRNRDLNFDNV